MKTLLDVSILVFLGVLAFGLALAVFLIWSGYFRLKAPTAPPPAVEIQSTALKALVAALTEARQREKTAEGTEKNRLAMEVRRLEKRHQKLEEQTWIEQDPYRVAIQDRDRSWLEWSKVYSKTHEHGRIATAPEKRTLRKLQQAYDKSVEKVEEERQFAIGRDTVNLEELKGQGVLQIDPTEQPESKTETLPEQVQGFSMEDLAATGFQPSGLVFTDTEFDLSFTPDGVAREIDFSGCTFRRTHLEGMHLYSHCNFEGAWLERIQLLRGEHIHQFVGCNFRGANFTGSVLEGTLFSGCDLSATQWEGAQLEKVKFVDCLIDDIQWQDVDLTHTIMDEAMLTNADFSTAGAPPYNVQHPKADTGDQNLHTEKTTLPTEASTTETDET